MTPIRRRLAEAHLTPVSLSPRMITERMIVTTGPEKMIQRASGTGMKMTLAKHVITRTAPRTPRHKAILEV